MKFEYFVTIDDIIAFNIAAAQRVRLNDWWRSGRLPAAIITFAIIAMFVTLMTRSTMAGAVVGSIVGALIVAAYPGIQQRAIEKAVPRMLRKMYEKDAGGNLGRHEIELVDDGFIERTTANESRYRWEAIQQVEVTPKLILVWVGPLLAHVVTYPEGHPLRADFLDALRQGVPEKLPAV